MKTIATLGPSIRLVVFQFLMKNNLVPEEVPPKRASTAPPLSPFSGVEVLKSTSKLNIFPLASSVAYSGEYELVDVWTNSHESKWDMSFVRFVFCHKEHVKRDELFPEFVSQREKLEYIYLDLAAKNLWAVQGHLNPYFEKDGKPSGDKVLMLGCAGRVPTIDSAGNTIKVFRDGRDENNHGVGPKIPMREKVHQLKIVGNDIVIVNPELGPATQYFF